MDNYIIYIKYKLAVLVSPLGAAAAAWGMAPEPADGMEGPCCLLLGQLLRGLTAPSVQEVVCHAEGAWLEKQRDLHSSAAFATCRVTFSKLLELCWPPCLPLWNGEVTPVSL